MEIYNDLGNRHLIIIRFNPDSYYDIDNKKIDSLFVNKKNKLSIRSKTQLEYRISFLLECINKTISEFNIENKAITIEYLFYNENE